MATTTNNGGTDKTAAKAKSATDSTAAGTKSAINKTATATERAKSTAARTRRTTRTQARATATGVRANAQRVTGAAQAEVRAIANQPVRPLYFALGVADELAAQLKELPGAISTLPTTLSSLPTAIPTRAREVVIDLTTKAGDLSERAQQRYTEVAVRGRKLTTSVKNQESTQRARGLAASAQRRSDGAITTGRKAAEAGIQAVKDAAAKIG